MVAPSSATTCLLWWQGTLQTDACGPGVRMLVTDASSTRDLHVLSRRGAHAQRQASASVSAPAPAAAPTPAAPAPTVPTDEEILAETMRLASLASDMQD
mmetsp:Transcript_97325/g.258535  ORF Transcript_97325/g.258535 Transcript_97325/m.258535 type:complete len:99 (+) Transcript_97325:400-696(+)